MVSDERKPFAVFDIDGTLIRWQLYHAIADALAKTGSIDSKTYDSIRDARMLWKQRSGPESFKLYQQRLVEAYEKVLLNLSVKQFKEAVEAVFEEYKDQVYTYTRDLLKVLKAKKYLLFAISGSQTEIIIKIANYYGFDEYIGSTYLHKHGKFTGEVTFAFDKKDTILRDMVAKHNASWDKSIAVGDSAIDINMLEAVEKPIAFNPERRLFEHARSKEWKIVVERKNMIYELESRNGKYLLV